MATEQFNKELSEAEQKAKQKVTWAAGIIATIAFVALFLVFRFASSEQERDINSLKLQMSVVADSQTSALEKDRIGNHNVIHSLAENKTIQLYMMQAQDQASVEDLPETGYVRNLLISRAKTYGYYQPPEQDGLSVTPSSDHPGSITLTNAAGQPILSVGNRSDIVTQEFMQAHLSGTKPFGIAIEDALTQKPLLAYILPIYGVQSDMSGAAKTGYIVGVKVLTDDVEDLLRQKSLGIDGERHMIVRAVESKLQYVTIGTDGQAEVAVRGASSDVVTADALKNPGSFGRSQDYDNVDVFYVSRAIGKSDNWVYVYTVPIEVAMDAADSRRAKVVTILILLILLTLVVLVATWRHATSQKLEVAVDQATDLAQRFEDQKNMLHLVTDNQPRNIFIYDLDQKVRFANAAVARSFGLKEEDLLGKSVEAIFGPNPGNRYIVRGREAVETNSPVISVERQNRKGAELVLQTQHVPLEESSVAPAGVLVVEEDITTAVLEREQRERTMRQLVNTLVTLVDKRDPFAAGHSQRVGRIAKAISREMSLEDTLIETAEIAGAVMNLGKIVVPPEILTKPGELTDKEKSLVRDSIRTAADVLSVVEFDGPVVKTLRQVQERVDGTGTPEGWRGQDIIVTARIVAVANAFVALISPRAHRAGMSVDVALDVLQKQVGSAFDRRVVAALINFIDNHGGRDEWEKEALQAQKHAPTRNNPADEVADRQIEG